MQKHLLFLVLFFTMNSYSQSKNISVIYGKKSYSNNFDSTKDPNVLERIKSINNSFKNIEYELIINNEEATFSYIEQMQNDGNKISPRAITTGELEGKYYTNNSTDTRLQKIRTFDRDYIITDPINKYSWNISSDQKKINDFVCYKAKTTIKVDDFRGKYSYNIIVWFTPDLQYKFGPGSYHGNLPGLVLEVNYANKIVIYAKKINLNSNKKILKLKRGREVTRNEFEKIMTDTFEKIKNGEM